MTLLLDTSLVLKVKRKAEEESVDALIIEKKQKTDSPTVFKRITVHQGQSITASFLI